MNTCIDEIIAECKRRKITQLQLAHKIGCSQAQISRFFNGATAKEVFWQAIITTVFPDPVIQKQLWQHTPYANMESIHQRSFRMGHLWGQATIEQQKEILGYTEAKLEQ